MKTKNKGRLILIVALCLASGATLFSVAREDAPSEIPKELVKLLFEDTCLKGCSDEKVTLWKSNLKHRLEDLNGDAVPEFFLWIEHSDWCGAGSNCSFWVYQRTKDGYELLLEDKVLRARDTVTNGYRDVASEIPWGFCAVNVQRLYVEVYRYDGKEYRGGKREDECRPFMPKHQE